MTGYGIHMTTTKTYRNDSTNYWVTLTDSGHGVAAVTDSLGYRFPMVGSDYAHAATLAASRAHNNGAVEVVAVPAPAPMASPLPAELQVRSARPLAVGVIGLPSLPQARCLQWVVRDTFNGKVMRGYASTDGRTAPMPVLIAMSRRGWLELDHPIRPTSGTITDAGRNALAAYVVKHGEVQ